MPKRSGFTLIELLIVIAIIAVLSVIGIVVYSGAQTKARDVRRKADLQQMATAYEVNYNSGQYISLAGTQFSSGQIPKDPKDNVNYTCIKGPDSNCTTTDQTSFQICATLEDGSTFCRQAAQGGEGIAVVIPPTPSPSPAPPPSFCPSGLAAYWKMDEASALNFIDSFDSNNGTPSGTSVNASGKINNARTFNGTSDYVSLPAAVRPSAGGTTNTYSLSMWVKRSTTGVTKWLFGNNNGSGASGVELQFNSDNTISFNKIAVETSTTTGTITDTTIWHHIAVSAGAGGTKIYIDGSQSGPTGGTANFIDYNAAVFLGARNGGGSAQDYFSGSIDEVGIWNKELSSQEVIDLYNSGTGNQYAISGSVASGIGTGMLFQAQDSAGTIENIGRVSAILTNVTDGLETSALTFETRTGGGALIERLRIDGNGNVGIGTSVPNATLSIQGNLGIGYTGINQVIPSNGLAVSGNVGIGITTANSALTVNGGASIGSSNIVAPTNGLFVLGNVGIGATTPTANLDIKSTATTGTVLNISATGLTTGKLLDITDKSTSTSQTPSILNITDRDLTVGGHTDRVANTAVKQVFVYDTTRDPDGGKWTDDDRARASTWYNESLNNGTTRGATRAFPKKAILVLETSKITIYDAKDNTLWMGITADASIISRPNAIYAFNGKIYVANVHTDLTTANSISVFDFIVDRVLLWGQSAVSGGCGAGRLCEAGFQGIGGRPSTYGGDGQGYPQLVNSVTNLSNLQGVGSAPNAIHAQIVNGKSYFVTATDMAVFLINETDQVARRYSDNAGDDYNAAWLDKEGNLWALNETLGQLELWKKVVNDTSEESGGTPDKVWDEASTPALTNTAPTIQAASPQNLFVTDGTSTVDGKSQTVYVGTDQGVSVVNTNRSDESNSSVKYLTKDWISEEMVGDIRGMWHLTDNAASATVDDVTLKANDLTLYADSSGTPTITANTSTVTTAGVRGKGFNLNGSSNFLYQADTDADFDFTSGSFTISMWINSDSFATNSRTLLTYGNNSTTGYDLELTRVSDSQATITFKTYQAGPASQSTTSTASTINTEPQIWQHIAVVRSGTSARIYVNGHDDTASAGTHTNPVSAVGAGPNLVIGAKQSGASQWYDGQIDDIMITAEALNPNQIKHIYNVGLLARANREGSDTDSDGSSTADSVQQLYGSTNTTRAIAIDPGNSYLYVATNNGSDAGGISVIGINSDTREDVFSNDNATANKDSDDSADPLTDDDWISVSVAGAVGPTASRTGFSLGGTIAMANTAEIYMETKDTSFQDFAKNNYNPFGETLFQNNLNVNYSFAVGTQWLPANATSGIRSTEVIQNSIFRVDGIGDVILGANNNQANGAGANKSVRLTFNALDNSTIPLLEGASLWYDSVNNDIRTNAASGITTTQQTYDIAEDFPTRDTSIEAGDVVAVDKEASASAYIAKSNKEYQNDVIGIVSTNPGFRLSQEDGVLENPVKVALAGRVPVKVSTENGPIEVGDFLTSSSFPGVAMRATRPGQVVGKALEAFSGEEIGKILAFINISYADPGNFFASLSLDNEGNLIIPKLKAGSILLDPSLATASAQLSIDNGQLTLNEDPNYNSTGPQLASNNNSYDLAGKIASLEERIAHLEAAQNTSKESKPTFEVSTAEATPSATLASTKLDLTPPDILLATGSATLANLEVTSEATFSGMLAAYDLNISNSLKSLGETTLGKTLIAGDLIVDGMLTITGSSLSNLSILYIQNSPLAEGLDIFNGKVIIDKEGNITTQGKITASEVETNKLTILAASIGTATLPANTTKIIIPSTLITPSSKIFITPTTATDKVLSVTNIKDGESFDVSVTSPTQDEIKFNWWIVETN